MININDKEYTILKKILSPTKIQFYAFGSRVQGTHKEFSDLDLCYKEDLDKQTLIEIKNQLSDSNLAFFVDLVDYNDCSDTFKTLIDKDLVPLEI